MLLSLGDTFPAQIASNNKKPHVYHAILGSEEDWHTHLDPE